MKEIAIEGTFPSHYEMPLGNIPTGYSLYPYLNTPNPEDPSESPWRPPETQVPRRSDIPPHEHNDFFNDGSGDTRHTIGSWKLFRDHRALWVRAFTLRDLRPTLHRFSLWVYADAYINNDQPKIPAPDPLSGQMRFYCEGGPSEWFTMAPFLEKREYVHDFTGAGNTTSIIGAEFKFPHPIKNAGVFTFDWRLWELDSPPDPPPSGEQYDRVVHLVPQSATLEQAQGVSAITHPDRQSKVYSAHDAFITHPDLRSRTVYVYNPDAWGGKDALEDWVIARYPPLPTIHYRQFPGSPSYADHIVGQRWPAWATRKFGNGTYMTTMFKEGCLMGALSSARSYYNIGAPDANETLDLLDESDFLENSARFKWPSAEKLGLKVDTISGEEAIDAHLYAGDVILGRVDPPGDVDEHWVLWVDWARDNTPLIIDPWYAEVAPVTARYPNGINRVLAVTKLDDPPDPPDPPPTVRKRSLLNYHLQMGSPGWDTDVARISEHTPNLPVKVVGGGYERCTEIRALTSGRALPIVRHVIQDNRPYIGEEFIHDPTRSYNPHHPDPYDPHRAATEFLNLFWPEGEVPPWLHDCFALQGLNETIATGNAPLLHTAVRFAAAFSDVVKERADRYSLAVKAVIGNIATGNPGHGEVNKLFPMAAAAQRNSHIIGSNAYIPFNPTHGPRWVKDMREAYHHWMRPLLSWDPAFRAAGYVVPHIIMEHNLIGAHVKEDSEDHSWLRPGPFVSAASGWRHGLCANGNWPVTLAALLTANSQYVDWNAAHNGMLFGVLMFTINAMRKDWRDFEPDQDERTQLVDALTSL